MLTCPECQTHYPHGSLVCLNDGHAFVENEESRQLVHQLSRGVHFSQPLIIGIEHVDGVDFAVPYPIIVISKKRLEATPIRIGRRDLTATPPIFPEIDFHNYFAAASERPPISRLHAAIEVINGYILLRSSSSVPTYIRKSGETKAVALTQHEYHKLEDRDTVYLASPEGRHVRLRVFLSPA